MKKVIAACFAFMFLLAVVAGCPPTKESSTSSDTPSTDVKPFDGDSDGSGLFTSDDASDE